MHERDREAGTSHRRSIMAERASQRFSIFRAGKPSFGPLTSSWKLLEAPAFRETSLQTALYALELQCADYFEGYINRKGGALDICFRQGLEYSFMMRLKLMIWASSQHSAVPVTRSLAGFHCGLDCSQSCFPSFHEV